MTRSCLQYLTTDTLFICLSKDKGQGGSVVASYISTLLFETPQQLKERYLTHGGAEKIVWVISETKRIC